MTHRLLRLLMLLLLCPWCAAQASEHISARAWLQDAGHHPFSLAELQAQPFAPYTGVLARGYTPATLWLRLRIDPALGADATSHAGVLALPDDRLVLRIRPPYLDEVTLFDPLEPTPRSVGDRQSDQASAYPALSLNFSIPRGAAPRDIYLRVQTTSTSLLYVEAIPLAEAVVQDRRQELAISGFLALIAMSLLWAVLDWLATRDRLLGLFAIKQTMALLWGAMLMGMGRAVLGGTLAPPTMDTLTSLVVLVNVPASILFDYWLLREFRAPRAGLRVLLIGLAMSVLNLGLFATGHDQLALKLTATTGALCLILIFVLICLARPQADSSDAPPPLPKALPVAIYGLALLLTNASLAAQLGLFDHLGALGAWLRSPEVILYGNHTHSLTTGVMMVVLLHLRSRRLALHRQRMGTQLALAEDGAHREREHRQDRERLLAMLAHELKTPLSVIRLRAAALPAADKPVQAIKSAVMDITEVIDRCLETSLVEDRRLARESEPCDLADLLRAEAADSAMAARIVLDVPAQAPLRSDSALLRGIVNNLLVNASKYSAPDSPIRVTVQATRDGPHHGWRLSVSNLPGAAGWPDPAQLFDKYYRSPDARRLTGSGLGLYLVCAMCKSLGGSIRYAPTPTHIGFEVWLPA